MNEILLTIITFVPLVGAILVLMPWGRWRGLDKIEEEQFIKRGAMLLSLLPLTLAIIMWFGYNKSVGGFQFEVKIPGSVL